MYRGFESYKTFWYNKFSYVSLFFFTRPSGTIKYVIAGTPRLRQFIDHQPLWMKEEFHGR